MFQLFCRSWAKVYIALNVGEGVGFLSRSRVCACWRRNAKYQVPHNTTPKYHTNPRRIRGICTELETADIHTHDSEHTPTRRNATNSSIPHIPILRSRVAFCLQDGNIGMSPTPPLLLLFHGPTFSLSLSLSLSLPLSPSRFRRTVSPCGSSAGTTSPSRQHPGKASSAWSSAA